MVSARVRLLGVLAALAALAGCFSLGRGDGPVESFQFLAGRNPGLARTVTGTINEYADPIEISVVVPPGSQGLDLVATFTLNTEASLAVVSSGTPVPQQNGVTRNDFSAPVLYRLLVPGDPYPWRYRVTVRYADSDAALSRIGLPEGYALSPTFSPDVRSYTADVPFSVTRVRVDARGRSEAMADIAIDGVASGGPVASAAVDFAAGSSRVVAIETLAEDGLTSERYTLTLRRLPADGEARLASLDVAGAPLVPAFSGGRFAYQVEVPYDAPRIVVKAVPVSPRATVALQALAVPGRPSSARAVLPARGLPTDRAGATVELGTAALLSLVVAVTAEDGGVQEYLVDVRRAEPDRDATLASLAVDPGELRPAFDPRTGSYAVEVPYATRRVTVAARATSPLATLALGPGPAAGAATPRASGDLASRGGAAVEFAAERLSLAVAVTAQDGSVRTYALDVRRAPPDSNADLASLAASAGVLSPYFSPRVVSYAVSLPATVGSVTLTAVAASDLATVDAEGWPGWPAATRDVTVSVEPGAVETVNLLVTAEDGTQRLYRVRVGREAARPVWDTNARLASLRLSGATLAPAFRGDVLDYRATLPWNVSSFVLTATAESGTASVEVDGQPLARSGRTIALEPGTTRTVVVDVTAQSGDVSRTVIWASRERAGRDTNARLAGLRLSGATLAPAFRADVLEYLATVPASVPSVLLTASAESPTATIAVDGQPLARAGRAIALAPGATAAIVIDVTAESGDVSRTIVWATRGRASLDPNNRLAALRLAGATLAPAFTPLVLDYEARMGATTASVVLTATAESAAATVEVDGQPLERAGRLVSLEPGGVRLVVVDVTAENGSVASTTIWLSRDRTGPARDTNTRLAGLRLAGAALAPTFDPRVLEYAATMGADTDAVLLTATAESPVATIAVDGQPLARTGRVIAVSPGASKVVRVEVTAESGAVARTTVRLSREAARDANTRLARLSLAGADLAPSFDPRVLEYSARLAANVSSVLLTAAAESPTATVTVDGQPLARTGRVISLEPGVSRTVVVEVTAESGAVARTFVRLSREAAKDANTRLARLALAGADLAPDFDPRVLDYSARLAANVASVLLTAAAESPAATIELDGQPLARTGRVLALEPGASRTVVLDVTAESGAVARTLVRLSRDAAMDTNTRLARLALAGARLEPSFDPRVLAYAARLDANVSSVLLTAAAESPAASVTVDGQPLARTGRVITVDPGQTTTATLEVRAESGATSRTVLRLSRAGGPVTPPGGNTGGQAVLAIDGVRLAKREAAAVAEARATIGSTARITVRYHRAIAIVAQGEAPVSVKMQGATPVLDASWSAPVRIEADRAVEIAVAIPVGSSWLYYAEVRGPGDGLRVDVPFLLFARSPQVAWPAPGSPVRVAGFAGPSASSARGGTQALEVPEGVSRNDRGQFEVAVTITDAASGRVLAQETGYARPGTPREDFVVFARPITLPEGATVRYALSAKTKDGRGWSVAGTTVVLTTTLAYDGGFEPVVLRMGED